MEPNLFDFATKELSMDAFFCWLFAWSESKYNGHPLNKTANNFIKSITGKNIVIQKLKIEQQYKDIDFYLRINDKIIIVFEDKTESTVHDNQLEKYEKIISRDFPNEEKYFVYNKSNFVYNQERKIVEDSVFITFDINKIIELLKNDTVIDNIIYENYFSHLTIKREKCGQNESFLIQNISSWGNDEWRAFTHRLTNTIEYKEYEWHYGGSWWFVQERIRPFPVENVDITLGLCNEKFQINFNFYDENIDKNKIVNLYRELLFENFKTEKFSIKNTRICKSTIMLYFTDFLKFNNENCLNLQETVDYLEKIRKRLLRWINDEKQKTRA